MLKLNGYGGPQAKANEKRLRFKGWETLVNKNGFDGIAVFYKGENKVERIRYYEKDEEIWSKVEPEN